VVPASDGAIAALLPRRDEIEKLGATVALPPSSMLAVANDKEHTQSLADGLGISGPRTVRVERTSDLPWLMASLDPPFVLKPTTSWAGRSSLRLQAVDVVDEVEAERAVIDLLDSGVGALGQERVGGRREGVTLFLVDGEVHAAFAHLEIRTTPALGGASVVRRSIPLPQDIHTASVRL